ncbi:hypothetical protein TNCV_250831 [Trichonephila clavipes]|nr:hypothetical protein TNCV_250831 [Trichonephila clavipes]
MIKLILKHSLTRSLQLMAGQLFNGQKSADSVLASDFYLSAAWNFLERLAVYVVGRGIGAGDDDQLEDNERAGRPKPIHRQHS